MYRPEVKFAVSSLGPITEGELKLNRFTVVTGGNNTGKTYLTYAIYGFLSRWTQYVGQQRIPGIQELFDSGHMEVDLEPLLSKRQALLKKATADYVARLSSVLAAESNRFDALKLEVQVGDCQQLFETEIELEATSRRTLITASKPRNSWQLELSYSGKSGLVGSILHEREVFSYLGELLFRYQFPKTTIVSTERTGAVTFKSELNLSKSALLDAATDIKPHDTIDPSELFRRLAQSAYPLPVKDNVDFVNQLENLKNPDSQLLKLCEGLFEDFKDLVGGEYRVDRSGVLTFLPSKMKGKGLRMGESSSAVRSLVVLRFYLLHLARPGDLLMVDEPELNLHPSNQRKLARLLARVCNAGVNVFVTTHSDYLVRELNNLVQLTGLEDRAADLRRKYGYKADDGLAAEDLSLYTLRDCGTTGTQRLRHKGVRIESSTVDHRMGIDRTTFDDTILEMNDVQSDLFFASRAAEDREADAQG